MEGAAVVGFIPDAVGTSTFLKLVKARITIEEARRMGIGAFGALNEKVSVGMDEKGAKVGVATDDACDQIVNLTGDINTHPNIDGREGDYALLIILRTKKNYQ